MNSSYEKNCMKTLLLPVILIIAICISCEKDNEYISGFKPISENSVCESLKPVTDFDYYEIRNYFCFDTSKYEIIYSKGNKPEFDNVFQKNNGVIYTRADVCMFNNIFTVKSNEHKFWTTYNEIINFLGPIDSESDALFIAHLRGYYFKYDDDNYGIKKNGETYLIYAFQLVSACLPVETDRFLLEINKSGDIHILKREVVSREENACI